MRGVARRVAAEQPTAKLIIILACIEGKQATAAAAWLGHPLRPLHRDKAASVVEGLEALRHSLAVFFQVAFGVMDAVRRNAGSGKWRRVPRRESRARRRRAVQSQQIPIVIGTPAEKLRPAGDHNEVDVGGSVLAADRRLEEP